MKKVKQMRNALSMVELIFVITILGIVSSIGAEIIAQTYESYIIQRAQYRATSKTELALNEIANRLRYAIPGTVGFRATSSGSFTSITEANSGSDKVLQWVAYDGDSFEAITSDSNRKPGWSGFCDLTPSGDTSLSTPGSNLDLATEVISNLGGDIDDAEIYFPDGWHTGIKNSSTGETIDLDINISGNRIYERYKLAWSSYALSIESGDMYLYYNFSPTFGAALGNNKSLLLKNVTNFRFKGSEGSLRIKICKQERISKDANVTSCKEKVIF